MFYQTRNQTLFQRLVNNAQLVTFWILVTTIALTICGMFAACLKVKPSFPRTTHRRLVKEVKIRPAEYELVPGECQAVHKLTLMCKHGDLNEGLKQFKEKIDQLVKNEKNMSLPCNHDSCATDLPFGWVKTSNRYIKYETNNHGDFVPSGKMLKRPQVVRPCFVKEALKRLIDSATSYKHIFMGQIIQDKYAFPGERETPSHPERRAKRQPTQSEVDLADEMMNDLGNREERKMKRLKEKTQQANSNYFPSLSTITGKIGTSLKTMAALLG